MEETTQLPLDIKKWHESILHHYQYGVIFQKRKIAGLLSASHKENLKTPSLVLKTLVESLSHRQKSDFKNISVKSQTKLRNKLLFFICYRQFPLS